MNEQTKKEQREMKMKEAEKNIGIFKEGSLYIILPGLVPAIDIALAFLVSMITDNDDIKLWICIGVAVIVYCICGGLMTAIKMIWKATINSYLFIPLFPIDFLVAAFAAIITIMIAVFFPVVIILWNRHMQKENLNE